MSLKVYPLIIDSNLYTKTWKDDLYNELNDYIYGVGVYKDLTDSAYITRKIGRREREHTKYEELFFYKILIDYIINLKEAVSKSGVDVEEELESFKLDKIRANVLCRFNSTKLFDNLLMIANVVNQGIDYMQIGCLQDVAGSELQTNGDFSSIVDPIVGYHEVLRSYPFTINTATNISTSDGFDLSTLYDTINHLLSDYILTIGYTYRLSYDITILTSGKSIFAYGWDAAVPHSIITDANGSSVGTITIDFVATYTRLTFYTDASNGLGEEAFIKNISLKQYSGIDVCNSSNNPFIIE